MWLEELVRRWERKLLELELRESAAYQAKDLEGFSKARDDVNAVRLHLERLKRLENGQ